MKKSVIAVLLIFLLLNISMVYAAISSSDDTQAMRDLNDRLERSKAEIVKAVKDASTQDAAALSKAMDDNFGVLDKRIDDFLKSAKREIAIIMLAVFLIGFTLSQIIKLKIEQVRRKTLKKRELELEAYVNTMAKDAAKLAAQIKELKALDEKYSQSLKQYTKKQPFLSAKTIIFGIGTLCVGFLIAFVVFVILNVKVR